MGDDDSDLDIEELLKGLDVDGPSKKTSTTADSSQSQNQVPSKSNLKDQTVIQDPKPPEMVNGQTANQAASSKSVRFSYDIPDSTGTLNKKNPSSMLSNMFFSDDDKAEFSKPNDNQRSQTQPQPDISKNTSEPVQTKPKQVQNSNDWLGMGSGDDIIEPSVSTSNFRKEPEPPKTSVPRTVNKPTTQRRPSIEEFDENDLMKLLDSSGSGNWNSKDKPPSSNNKPPLPPGDFTKSRTSNKVDPQSVANSVRDLGSGPRSISPSAQFNLGKISDNSLKTRPEIKSISTGGFPVDFASNLTQESSKLKPSTNSQEPSSLLDALSFLKPKAKNQSPTMDRGDIDNNPNGQQGQAPASVQGGGGKKRVVGSKVTGSGGGINAANVNTLQLPSHLVNEDELKTMSSSLKTLYGNQLEMLENSYKEQLEFLALSNKRKEDVLKDEMSTLQDDYFQRIQRLRAELIENETRNPQKLNDEIANLSKHFENLSSKLEMLRSSSELQNKKITEINFQDINADLSKEFERLLEQKLNGVSKNIETSLLQQMKQSLEASVSQGVSDQSKQFQELTTKLENISGASKQNSELVLSKLNETEKNRQIELEKLTRSQRKLKETAVHSALESVTKIFENFREEDFGKRNKLAFQVKEFRKDLRRLHMELENKNDSVHKSQLSMESEQRTITQSIRDINTLLKVGSVNRPSQAQDLANQFATMHAVHQQTQNEMEIKLLKEERNGLTESMAELNVHRRKLTDEKLNLERDRMEFEREKIRIRDLEVQSKVRLAEAEELKRNAEVMRFQETKISGEMESKLQEMRRERSKMKERIFEMEQKLIQREQKLFQEKSDVIREKEFVDKLRDQLLCPGCLNSANKDPPPYFQQMRSDGDGFDFVDRRNLNSGNYGNSNNNRMRMLQMPTLNLTPAESAYLRKESRYSEDFEKSFTDL